jgi:glycosyltransferase involved in cell wall biosynthesis
MPIQRERQRDGPTLHARTSRSESAPPSLRPPSERWAPQGPEPLVSVVIPCYNVQAYVADSIRSALDQTYRHLEVIVVNDGATDATQAVIDATLEDRRDPRVRVVQQPNGGLSAARNSGLLAATGALIAFLDGDDTWRADKIEQHVKAMQTDGRIGLSFCFSEYMTEDGRHTGAVLATSIHEPTLKDMIRRNHFGNGSTVVARRECFELAGCFSPELKSCEDYEMWCRILWVTACRAVCVPRPLTRYRLRETSLSFNVMKFTANAELSVRRLRDQLGHVPASWLRRGMAEHYRIAAWKAAMSGQNRQSLHLLWRAVHEYPRLAFSDVRPAAIVAFLLLPSAQRAPAVAWIKRHVAGSAPASGA